MSPRRKTYDGSIIGSGSGDSKRRDTDDYQIETDEYASEKRSRRDPGLAQFEHDEYLENDKDRYLITYADLITLLLGLFIILYAMSNIDMEKYEATVNTFGDIFGTSGNITSGNVKTIEATPEYNQNFKSAPSLMNRLEQVISENGYGAAVKLIQNERGITVSILDDILFASGKAELNIDSKNVLNKLSNVIRTIPNDLRIEGHTDNIPITSNVYPSNWHLSVARATNTAYYLMNEERIPQGRVSIVGYSEFQPVVPNDTPEGRAQNRRVDIVILNK